MKQAVYNAVFTVVLCGISAVTLTFAKARWGPLYKAHKAGAKIGAIVEALGLVKDAEADPDRAGALFQQHVTTITKKGMTTYKAMRGGETIGYAIEVTGAGFEGPVEGILALAPDRRTILGFRIHHQEETPGLGAKIASREFLDQFRGKKIVGPDGEPGIRLVRKAGGPNEVDAITGATFSSIALERMLKTRITEFVFGQKLVALELELPRPAYTGTPTVPPGSRALPLSGVRRKPLMVPEGTKNVSRGRPVTASDEEPIIGELGMITDGDKGGGDESYVELGFDLQWVQVDLGAEHEICAVVIWRDHAEAAVYKDVIVQVSGSPGFDSGVETLFNNDKDNSADLGAGSDREYIETFEGRLVAAVSAHGRAAKGRYVRVYSAGSFTGELNRYSEIEVYGRPAGAGAEQGHSVLLQQHTDTTETQRHGGTAFGSCFRHEPSSVPSKQSASGARSFRGRRRAQRWYRRFAWPDRETATANVHHGDTEAQRTAESIVAAVRAETLVSFHSAVLIRPCPTPVVPVVLCGRSPCLRASVVDVSSIPAQEN